MIILLSAIGIASVLASEEFIMKRTRPNGLGVEEEHYLLIQPLGRKKLFGEASWNMVRGTPLKWQFQNNKIQVMGAFKKKNLCLFFKGNQNSPFTVKSCTGMFDNASMQIGCTDDTPLVGDTTMGKFAYSENGANPNPGKMISGYTTSDDTSICKVDGKDVEPLNDFDSITWFNAQDADDKAKLFFLEKEIDGKASWFSLRQTPHYADGLPEEDAKKQGNKKINTYEWERHVTKKKVKAAMLRWNGKQIEVIYPTDARIDGKPICLEMGKTNKMGDFPYKVQKCDRTVDRGNFGCSKVTPTYFGLAWNAKRYDEAKEENDLEKALFHLDKLDEVTYYGHSICESHPSVGGL